ncbi:MAG TPA: C39 family peptidase [Candidatus Methylomirabilis sp.]|jgi:ABC-type bacteriocin/lantibiotic exporter with double-glycine peptidase domain|nr:C39 family peptidase [Candidatus Methylomirabilis sp.]
MRHVRLAAGFLLLAACAGPSAEALRAAVAAAPEGGRILPVPFFPQEEYQCGPAAVASILAYWGISAEPAAIAEAIYLPRLKGTLSLDLLLYAEQRGLRAVLLPQSADALKAALRAGRPIIALLNVGSRLIPTWHYVVVVGYADGPRAFLAHDGRHRERVFSYDDFAWRWQASGQWALLVEPPPGSPAGGAPPA